MLGMFWVHTVTISGEPVVTPWGTQDGDPVEVSCFIDDTTKLIRDSSGDEVVSSATIFLPIEHGPVKLGTKVTMPASHGGDETTVLSCSVHDAPGLGLPECVEVALS